MMNIPQIGFGTWELRGNLCFRAVKTALEIGYRHIDTAIVYENQKKSVRPSKALIEIAFFLRRKFHLSWWMIQLLKNR